MENNAENKIKNYTLNFRIQNINKCVKILCKSNDKMEYLINKFTSEENYEKDLYSFICYGHTINKNETVVECGLSEGSDIFVVEKKSIENINSNSSESNSIQNNDSNLAVDNNNNIKIVGEPVTLLFLKPNGTKIRCLVGKNNTNHDVKNKYCDLCGFNRIFINEDLLFLF